MKKYLLAVLGLGTLIMIVVMARTGASLKTPVTPMGILDLEFAYDTIQTNRVIEAWTPYGNISAAKNNTGYDFIFLFFYSLFLFFGCRKIAQLNQSKIGLKMAKASLIVGVLDIVENTGMLATLLGYSSNSIAMITTIFAVVKWGLVICVVIYLLFALGYFLLRKNKTAK